MTLGAELTWSGGMTGNFVIPTSRAPESNESVTSQAIRFLLSSDGMEEQEVIRGLPRDQAKAHRHGGDSDTPNPRRYRDVRQLVRTVGLAYDVTDPILGRRLVRVTELGKAIMRWNVSGLTANNIRVIGRYAARAISAAQLRNPTKDGCAYSTVVDTFPFAFIWRAMLALECYISREELNRAIYWTKNEDDLYSAIERIRFARVTGDVEALGPRAIERGEDGNLTARRVRGWMSWASFGWTLFADDTSAGTGFRIVHPWARDILEEVSLIRWPHREFDDEAAYVEHLSACAGLPLDVRA